jgi:metal-dependent hydrolase (beta-lactamase superfamily II)
VDRIFTGHCTGDHAFGFLRNRLGDRILQFYSGFSCEII